MPELSNRRFGQAAAGHRFATERSNMRLLVISLATIATPVFAHSAAGTAHIPHGAYALGAVAVLAAIFVAKRRA